MPRPDGTPWLRHDRKPGMLDRDLSPANTTTLDKWLASMAQKPPAVRERIDLACDFFKQTCRKSDPDTLSELICTDFSKPVQVIVIPTDTYLIGYKIPGAGKGSYFTRVGTGPQRLGISFTGQQSWLKDYTERNKEFRLFRVCSMIPQALESTAAPASDRWSFVDRRVMSAGGGVQFCIPDANVRVEQVEARDRKKGSTAVVPAKVLRGR